MRVEVRSVGELRVAEALGNDFEIHPCGQGQTRAGVAKVVQSCRTRRPKGTRVRGPPKGTEMSLRSIRRRCEAAPVDVPVPNPFDINDFCQRARARRSSPSSSTSPTSSRQPPLQWLPRPYGPLWFGLATTPCADVRCPGRTTFRAGRTARATAISDKRRRPRQRQPGVVARRRHGRASRRQRQRRAALRWPGAMLVLVMSSRRKGAQMRVVEIIPDLHVEDLEKAREFYAQYLGLSTEEFNMGWVARYTSPEAGVSLQIVTQDAPHRQTPSSPSRWRTSTRPTKKRSGAATKLSTRCRTNLGECAASLFAHRTATC